MKDNEQTNQIVKKIAVRSTITNNEKMFLAHVRKVQTKVREAYKQD